MKTLISKLKILFYCTVYFKKGIFENQVNLIKGRLPKKTGTNLGF